ncbi:MAG TPA: GAF domain-containing sensor histidine kinase [Anaerolineaceae bacterium]|nr:GAF domain-containing sensor histidine kinase [Anaerolineaceae bacterium]
MRTSDFPFLADWFTVSTRWLCIVGFTMTLAYAGKLDLPSTLALGGATVWNLINALFAAFNVRMPGHRIWNVMVDFGLSLVIFTITGLLNGPLAGCALMVLFSSAIYFTLRGSLIVAILISAAQVGLVFLFSPASLQQPLPLVFLAGFNLLSGILLGLFGGRLMSRLRKNYFNVVKQRKEHDKKTQNEERTRLQAIYQMTETLSSTLGYQAVLNATLDVGSGAMRESPEVLAQLISAVLLFDDSGQLKIESARHLPAPDLRNLFTAEQGVLKEALRTADQQWITSPGKDPELSALSGLRTCQSALILPLHRGLNSYGALLFAHPNQAFFTPERRDLLMVVAQQAVIAIQNARMFQDIQEEKERIVNTQEEGRKKLARDLHDGPTQSISALAMQVNIARKILEKDPVQAAEELVKIEDLARRTTQEMRHMLFTLRPLVLESEGLEAALQTIADKMRDVFQQNVTVAVNQSLIQLLDMPHQTIVFYLVEEAVNNARKHAQASQIAVRLDFHPSEDELAILEIADNGIGFDLKSVSGNYDRRGSLGMINLQERSQLINALLHIDTAPGKGTRVRIYIPLSDNAYQRLHNGDTSL